MCAVSVWNVSISPEFRRILGQSAEWLAGIGLVTMPWFLAYGRFGLDFSIAAIGVGYLLHCLLTENKAWLKLPVVRVMMVWAVWMSCIVAPFAWLHPADSLAAGLEWLRYPLLFLALTRWILLLPRWRHAFVLSLGAALLMSLLETIVQLVRGTSLSGRHRIEGRLTGPLKAPNIGVMMSKMSLASVALIYWLRPQWLASFSWRSVGLGTLFTVILLVVLASGERSASLLLLSGLFIATLACSVWRPCWRWRVLGGLFLLGVMGTVLIQHYPFMQDRIALMNRQLAQFGQTDYGQLWQGAWHMAREAPLHGIGLRDFRQLCSQYMDPSLLLCHPAIHPHNFSMEWLAEGGLGGLALFWALVAACSWPLLRWFGCRTATLQQHACDAMIPACMVLTVLWMNFFPLVPSQSNWNGWNVGLSWLAFGCCFAAWKELSGKAES